MRQLQGKHMKRDTSMNHVERFRAIMNFQPVDRLPRWEWAMWWDETIARWHGRRAACRTDGRLRDRTNISVWTPTSSSGSARRRRRSRPRSTTSRASSPTWTTTSASARACFPTMAMQSWSMRPGSERQEGRGRGLDHAGRLLLVPADAAGHRAALMYAFYDQPELMHRINQDLLDFNLASSSDRANLPADIHDLRRGHVLQPRPDALARDCSTSSWRPTTARCFRGSRRWASDHRGHRR